MKKKLVLVMIALLLLALPAFALADNGGVVETTVTNILIENAVNIAAAFFIALIGVFGAWLTAMLGKSTQLDTVNRAQQELIKLVQITVTPFVTGVENYINEAIAQGIPVVTLYGESLATANDTGRLCFIGQDNEVMGQVVGQTILDKTEPGKYAVITASFTMENLELKRNTAQKILDDAGYEFVGAYEAKDSADETYSLTQDILTANPDIVAIYCVAGGNYGCPKAVADMGKTGSVYVIGHDETSVNLQYVRTGEMDVVGQNPTGVSFDGFMYLYNKVVGNQDPPQKVFASYSMTIDKTNVNELFPE